jgi:hypothetical protein
MTARQFILPLILGIAVSATAQAFDNSQYPRRLKCIAENNLQSSSHFKFEIDVFTNANSAKINIRLDGIFIGTILNPMMSEIDFKDSNNEFVRYISSPKSANPPGKLIPTFFPESQAEIAYEFATYKVAKTTIADIFYRNTNTGKTINTYLACKPIP